MSFESSVSFSYRSCRNDFVWLLNLCLKVPPDRPMYVFSPSLDEMLALYMRAVVKHSPRKGQLSLVLQLHLLSWVGWFSFFMMCELCPLIIEFIFSMQL